MKTFLFLMAFAIAPIPSLARGQDALQRLEKIQREVDALPAKFGAAKSKVTIEGEVITVRATDVDDAIDTVMAESLRHVTKRVKLVIAKKTLEQKIELIESGEAEEITVGLPLTEAFRWHAEALSFSHSGLADVLKSDPTDWRKHVAEIEKIHGTVERHAKLHDLERARRATWLMMLRSIKSTLSSVSFE